MILMYHKVDLVSPTLWWVDANQFYRQMVELANKEVVYLNDYDPKNENHVVITFDGVYKNVYQYALPILRHFDYPFELFITSNYIGKDNSFDKVEPLSLFANKKELKELVNGGGRLQWHTKTHRNLRSVKDDKIIADELEVPNEIRRLDNSGFEWFAYPHGEFNQKVIEETKKRFKGAISCIQGNTEDRFKFNRLTVVNDTKLRKAKISCIIASYNYGDFLIEAVESVLKQTVLPDEILISDDCSDDETQLIAQGFVKRYPGLIRYNRNKVNLGIVEHFNKAASLTSGDYMFFLGADNRLVSNYVENSSCVLDSQSNVAVAYTDYALFGSRAKLVYDSFSPLRKGRIRLDKFYQIIFPEFTEREKLIKEINSGNFIHGSSMFKRKAFNDVGGYIKSGTAEDYNLFIRIIEKGWDVQKVLETNLEYRQHSISQANNTIGILRKMIFYKDLFERKDSFEKSKLYKIAFNISKVSGYLVQNYKNPKKLLKGLKLLRKKITKAFSK